MRWLVTILALSLSGCSAIGVLAYKVYGPPKIEAKYTPAKAPTLVLVENYQHQSSARGDADLLARYLADDLAANNVAPMVDLDRLTALRDAKPMEYPKMSISGIGQTLAAKQVIYVRLLNSDVTPLPGGEALQGSANVRVKLVDADTGETIWPTDLADGYPLSATTKLGSHSTANAMDVRERLYHNLADQAAKLFYKWTPEDDRPEDMR